MKEAILYKKLENKEVLCYLCHRMCRIENGARGFCRVRENRDGELYSLNYGKAVATNIDAIEKKPFYHFKPGSEVFSFATVGCNFRCKFCQNWDMSNAFKEIIGEDLSPERIVEITKERGLPGIAYTYTEPTIFMEYALDTARIAKKEGMFNVFVTNGYMTPAAIKEMKGLIDASRIDLKGFDEKTYKELSYNVELEYVLQDIKELHKVMHIELINLIIPGYNDGEEDIIALSKWVAGLDKNIPLHFTAFYPAFKMMDTPPTKLETLKKARSIAIEEGVRYAYTGNRGDVETESTYCYNCGELLIERRGFGIIENKLKEAKCFNCGKKQNIVL